MRPANPVSRETWKPGYGLHCATGYLFNPCNGLQIMVFRGWINGKIVLTDNPDELENADSVEVYIRGIWQVWR